MSCPTDNAMQVGFWDLVHGVVSVSCIPSSPILQLQGSGQGGLLSTRAPTRLNVYIPQSNVGPESTPNARSVLRNRKRMTSTISNTKQRAAPLSQISVLLHLQLVLFPAYCALVGAAILFYLTCLATIVFPASVHLLARISYILLAHCLPFTAPPTLIRVFAHWATVAHSHVAIFLALLVGIAYVPAAGLLLSGLCGALFVGAAKMGLEAEVRGMLYQILVAPECDFADGEKRADILAADGLDKSDSGGDADADDE
ncbi:hypothetical protein C8R46DRAFT_1274582 [Mycena filopes]|nr:hypothetical protein C8R46DRAFT_1274582 [Mycena filopes]